MIGNTNKDIFSPKKPPFLAGPVALPPPGWAGFSGNLEGLRMLPKTRSLEGRCDPKSQRDNPGVPGCHQEEPQNVDNPTPSPARFSRAQTTPKKAGKTFPSPASDSRALPRGCFPGKRGEEEPLELFGMRETQQSCDGFRPRARH